MARITRQALDFTLISLSKVGPAVSNLWQNAKAAIAKTQAKRLVCNAVVDKAEIAIDKLTDIVISLLTKLRDRQLPKELQYLEKEIERIKCRIQQKK